MTQCDLLHGRGVLAVSGEDARSFLQGLITNDIHKVTPRQAIFAALLSPQGKYLFEFFISLHENILLLELRKDRIAELIKRLTLYRLRAKVTFEERPELSVAAAWGDNPNITGAVLSYEDPRLPALGKRFLFKNTTASPSADYETHRLQLGIPEGGSDLIVDRSILLEFGYDHLHAIDFHKGCYVGQEVTARSKHRATLHKYIHCVSGDTTLPPSGTVVIDQGRELGDMRSSKGTAGLAVLRTADTALSQHLLAGEIPIRAHLPAWIAS